MSKPSTFRQLCRAVAALWRVHERPDPLHEVLPRYMDGTLAAEGVAFLDEKLRHGPVQRKRFTQILLNEHQLRELGEEPHDVDRVGGP